MTCLVCSQVLEYHRDWHDENAIDLAASISALCYTSKTELHHVYHENRMSLRSFFTLEPVPRGLEFNHHMVVALFCDSACDPCRGGELYQNTSAFALPRLLSAYLDLLCVFS